MIGITRLRHVLFIWNIFPTFTRVFTQHSSTYVGKQSKDRFFIFSGEFSKMTSGGTHFFSCFLGCPFLFWVSSNKTDNWFNVEHHWFYILWRYTILRFRSRDTCFQSNFIMYDFSSYEAFLLTIHICFR